MSSTTELQMEEIDQLKKVNASLTEALDERTDDVKELISTLDDENVGSALHVFISSMDVGQPIDLITFLLVHEAANRLRES